MPLPPFASCWVLWSAGSSRGAPPLAAQKLDSSGEAVGRDSRMLRLAN